MEGIFLLFVYMNYFFVHEKAMKMIPLNSFEILQAINSK